LHICKPSHHFASTISGFHVGLCPPGPPPRAISLRPSALPAARARPPYRACPPSLQLPYAATSGRCTWPWSRNRGGPSLVGTFPQRRTEVDGAELTRTTTATNDERGLGWAATGAKTWAERQLATTWPGRRLARMTYVKMA